ncbi:hypothetical protein [Aureispira sp. CCB-E]|uniref:hypothetical protein n=1 Tax=Aureispira sp. CCB-E TaxID=3051121 RepID=UPI0028695F2F|nr:hypothetical protein [Aureispira sp. CCB-E]WMX15268.1 hypothetical protein QP953_02645 [Aureispira sp. CCB-E]
MFDDLNATFFKFALPFYSVNFETLLSKIINCYQMMIEDDVSLRNDENSIRDVLLLSYLKDNMIRRKLSIMHWQFEREVQEKHSVGRTDIKVTSVNNLLNQEAYYTFECKRLDDKNLSKTYGLNGKYIKDGIKRFTDKYYLSHYRVNAMIGFVVKKININTNILEINKLLKGSFSQIKTETNLVQSDIVKGFEHLYESNHLDIDNDRLKIYHLMFDFSDNMS